MASDELCIRSAWEFSSITVMGTLALVSTSWIIAWIFCCVLFWFLFSIQITYLGFVLFWCIRKYDILVLCHSKLEPLTLFRLLSNDSLTVAISL